MAEVGIDHPAMGDDDHVAAGDAPDDQRSIAGTTRARSSAPVSPPGARSNSASWSCIPLTDRRPRRAPTGPRTGRPPSAHEDLGERVVERGRRCPTPARMARSSRCTGGRARCGRGRRSLHRRESRSQQVRLLAAAARRAADPTGVLARSVAEVCGTVRLEVHPPVPDRSSSRVASGDSTHGEWRRLRPIEHMFYRRDLVAMRWDNLRLLDPLTARRRGGARPCSSRAPWFERSTRPSFAA